MNEQEAADWSNKLSALAGWRATPDKHRDGTWTLWAQAIPDGAPGSRMPMTAPRSSALSRSGCPRRLKSDTRSGRPLMRWAASNSGELQPVLTISRACTGILRA